MNVIRHSRAELLKMQNSELSKTRPPNLSMDFMSLARQVQVKPKAAKQKAYGTMNDEPKRHLEAGSGDRVSHAPLPKDATLFEKNCEENGNAKCDVDNEEEVGIYLHYFNLINKNISKLLVRFSL